MKEKIVITEHQYVKSKSTFDKVRDEYEIITSLEDEVALADKVITNKSRAVIVGVRPYREKLYYALKEVGGDSGALIARYGVGYDNIDLELAKKCNIVVTNTPELGPSVAELAVFLMGALARNIPQQDRVFHNGKFLPMTGEELYGKKLIVAGFGRIGKKVAKIASFGFGMKVIASATTDYSKSDIDKFRAEFGIVDYTADLDSILGSADFISIHMSATDKTHHFFDANRLSRFKGGAYLINTARGRIIDEVALYDALVSGRLRGAALDVFENEPYEPIDPKKDLRRLDNVILTPHIGTNTTETNERIANQCIENVRNFFTGNFDGLNRVN